MSKLVFNEELGGTTTLQAQDTAANFVLNVPADDGTLVHTDTSGTATFDNLSLTGAVVAGAWDADTIDVAHGGTGAVTLTGYVKGTGTTAMTANATIPNTDITGLGTMSVQDANAVAITGGAISGISPPIPVASGGSGAATLTGYVIGNGTSAMTASATIPNTDITGLGTMSTQNANAVAITGGTVSGLGTPLAVPSGGTGAATLTGYVKGAGTSAMTASATIPNTDITGLGTMSTQGADAVAITGGTADGLTIGASNPAAVTATTLRVNSTVSLAGNTGTAGQVLTSNGGSAPTWESVAGVGTVTSVDGSGGTTGLSLSGGPITASGTLTLGGTLAVANGGTGATNAGDALTNLGAYPASNPSGFGVGTVTSVTGSAPIASSGGATPAISISQATTSTDGYLSSTDWNTFNGKGTVTSVGGTGTVNGLSLSGTVTSSGNLTLGGTLDLSAPPAIGGTTPAAGTFNSLTDSGNLTFTGTGNRITGDFSNATFTNRVSFQSSTSNGATVVQLIPNGTSTASQIAAYGGSDILNTSVGQLTNNGTEVRFASGIFGTGTYLPMTFLTGGSERVRIDTSGNLLVGSASYLLSGMTAGQAIQLGARTFIGTTSSGDTSLGGLSGSNLTSFLVNGTERGRFDSSGSLLVGTTSSTGDGCTFEKGANGGRLYIGRSNADSVAEFQYSGTRVGQITITASTTSYVTSSDYRLKENVAPMTGALEKVTALKPVTYTWKADGSAGQGFIAHELQAVVPDCVAGEKDAVDADGNPRYQGVDTSFLVATLVAAIQELKAEFDAYKADHP